jgi:hypothetical protein
MPAVPRDRGGAGPVRPRRVAHVVGVEPVGQPLVERFQRAEIAELLRVPRRVGVAPRDDVAPVGTVFARGPEELLTACECRRQFVPERPCRRSGEPVCSVRERENQFVVECLSAGRFLDQPPGDGFLYPRVMSGVTSY